MVYIYVYIYVSIYVYIYVYIPQSHRTKNNQENHLKNFQTQKTKRFLKRTPLPSLGFYKFV